MIESTSTDWGRGNIGECLYYNDDSLVEFFSDPCSSIWKGLVVTVWNEWFGSFCVSTFMLHWEPGNCLNWQVFLRCFLHVFE